MDIDLDHSPPIAELLVFGTSSHAGVAATLVALASRGRLAFAERPDGRHTITVSDRESDADHSLPHSARWLLERLRCWAVHQAGPPEWSGWRAALSLEATSGGRFSPGEWRTLQRWSRVPLLARRAVPFERARGARELATQLRTYPATAGDTPTSREAWDRALSYAVAFRAGRGFLARARQVNEYYARHFQGVVMTFYTPSWYAPLRIDDRARFAYLTTAMPRLLHKLSWDRIIPG